MIVDVAIYAGGGFLKKGHVVSLFRLSETKGGSQVSLYISLESV